MKFYLLFLLFFLNFLSLPFSAFTLESKITESSSNQNRQSIDSLPMDQEGTLNPNHYFDYEENPAMTREYDKKESDTFQSKFFNMLFLLALLIGFMILASWALKRMMKAKMTQLNTDSYIKILETRYLSPRATLYLVEVQNQAILISESPTAVTYLATLPLEEKHTSFKT